MCIGCGLSIPVCTAGSCSSLLGQDLKMVVLAASPVVGGVTVWMQSKIIKKKLQKEEEKKA